MREGIRGDSEDWEGWLSDGFSEAFFVSLEQRVMTGRTDLTVAWGLGRVDWVGFVCIIAGPDGADYSRWVGMLGIVIGMTFYW